MRRIYTSGSRWAFWRWKNHPKSDHIGRLVVFQCPLFSICVHFLFACDPEPYLHDHPVSFLSLILRGGYEELRLPAAAPLDYLPLIHKRHWVNRISAKKTRHSICHVCPDTTTLCFMGPREQVWGFYTPQGRIPWQDYYASGPA